MNWNVDDRVIHSVAGEGVVASVDREADMIVIIFTSFGNYRRVFSFAEAEQNLVKIGS